MPKKEQLKRDMEELQTQQKQLLGQKQKIEEALVKLQQQMVYLAGKLDMLNEIEKENAAEEALDNSVDKEKDAKIEKRESAPIYVLNTKKEKKDES